jgi:ferredoxin-NADP reductase
MAGTAVRGRLNVWQIATVAAVSPETSRARTLQLSVPAWAGPGAGRHRAGQHVDVRLTADDGYQAERAYSIASAPGETLAITVERVDDGEVSSWLTQEARPGDLIEVRGPIGGYFVWEPAFGGPLLLAAGGSGIVPLRSMLRARSEAGSHVPVRLFYSSRSWEDVIYASELDFPGEGVQVIHTLTRSQPPAWAGYARRGDQPRLAEVAWPVSSAGRGSPGGPGGPGRPGGDDGPLAYVCGPTSFVETVAAGLVALGYPAGRVRTERFGAGG